MNTKADALATRFEQACRDLASTINGMNDLAWNSTTSEEGWTVAAVAHHAAGSSVPISMMAEAAGTGAPMPPLTMDALNQMNANHAMQYTNVSRAETLALLRETTGAAAATVRSLSDEQLNGKAVMPFGAEMTAEQIIENVLIGHLIGHGASITAAVPA
ncbi:MAG: DinB family protein [Dehalococcoidia bacterium]|nr:MAG: DinB family protein [Dehalococcoidia bacterium]